MSYDYSSESKLLELPNPYRLQNRLLWLCAAILLTAGAVSLWWARSAMQERELRLVWAPLLAGVLMLALGIGCAATAARRLRFFFGRGRPASLAHDIPTSVVGTSEAATEIKDMLRQGSITYPEPQGAIEGLLYHWTPTLITAPVQVQLWAQRNMFNLAAIALTLLSFLFSWGLFGTPATQGWTGILYFGFGAFFLLKPVLSQDRARLSVASVVGLLASAILGPVLLALLGPALPKLGSFSLNTQVLVMLFTSLVACVLAMAATLAQVDASPQTRASVEQQRLSMSAPPAVLMDELDRTLQSQWTDRIPNRRYSRIDPVTPASTPAGSFAGELLEETQPLPIGNTKAPTLDAAMGGHRHRALLWLDLFAVAQVLAAVGLALAFVRGFDVNHGWERNHFSLAGTAAILALVAGFCFQTSSQLWGRFNFESVLIWVELIGNYQTSRVGTGNQFTSRLNTQSDVVRTEGATLRVWRSRIESVVFGKDGRRHVTAMFSTEKDAQSLAAHLMQFAQNQSVLVAPVSGADNARMAALQRGEQALSGESDRSAEKIDRDLRVAAALSSATEGASGDPAGASVHCTQCGVAASPEARFCARCGAALTPPPAA